MTNNQKGIFVVFGGIAFIVLMIFALKLLKHTNTIVGEWRSKQRTSDGIVIKKIKFYQDNDFAIWHKKDTDRIYNLYGEGKYQRNQKKLVLTFNNGMKIESKIVVLTGTGLFLKKENGDVVKYFRIRN